MYNNKPISSDDPKAVEKLQEKLGALEKSQEYMKRVNAYFRKHDTINKYFEIIIRGDLKHTPQLDRKYKPA